MTPIPSEAKLCSVSVIRHGRHPDMVVDCEFGRNLEVLLVSRWDEGALKPVVFRWI